MGFCLLNSVAITAAALADAGERVVIVDFDAHHGNGTQDVFYADDRVLFISLHQYPWYPGSGRIDEMGAGAGTGYTVNVPFPAMTAGPAYRAAVQRVIWPRVEAFRPTWLLVSAGFDGHRLDPLAQLGLTSGDYADLTAELAQMVPPGRVVAYLEGGYHLDGLAWSVAATVGALMGEPVRPEPSSTGETGLAVVEAVRQRHGIS
jgi:acetoin utilization deacetylase AcuC-like enzyme